ncbi:uncharacterized protein N7496_012314 [Penicillium cataractarum]|uniref:Alkyl hydroperoxide reductase subunit C/ Thiol specific antioxidant domain-containing protein n=1 Tax=Penicillium cataractarum TaxID=2100454 RepID=A0A9W9R7K9_9EURO|nr:uncharacterized protein N7496_012314 [Penicillium cataractarum]KAJ5355102.1 hypothetical protein N7496_012314 [Penicillium cataractarum]
MNISKEFASWFSPSYIKLATAPRVGDRAPSDPKLVFPTENKKPTVVACLRHCGCPFSEATFLAMRTAATQHPNISFIAISHSDQQSTEKWLADLKGPGSVTVVVDAERSIYAKWGLGVVSWGHVISPAALVNAWKLGKEQGIWNRPTESGSRWQSGGYWAVDQEGYVRWGYPAARADDVLNVDEAVKTLRRPHERL